MLLVSKVVVTVAVLVVLPAAGVVNFSRRQSLCFNDVLNVVGVVAMVVALKLVALVLSRFVLDFVETKLVVVLLVLVEPIVPAVRVATFATLQLSHPKHGVPRPLSNWPGLVIFISNGVLCFPRREIAVVDHTRMSVRNVY